MTDLVDELRKAHEAAQPGKWLVSHEIALAEFEVVVALPNQPYPDVVKSIVSTDWGTEEDANFIALAHNSMPLVLAVLEAACEHDICRHAWAHATVTNPEEYEPLVMALVAASGRLSVALRALKGDTP